MLFVIDAFFSQLATGSDELKEHGSVERVNGGICVISRLHKQARTRKQMGKAEKTINPAKREGNARGRG